MSSPSILLIGSGGDPHVAAVQYDLLKSGHEAVLFDCYDAGSKGLETTITGDAGLIVGNEAVPLDRFHAVWWRLKPGLLVPTATVSQYYDYQFNMGEWRHIFDFVGMRLERIHNVNNGDAARRAANKLHQLDCARRCGLNIPRTLVSNSEAEVLSFVASGDSGKFIFKTLNAYMNPDGRMTYTTIVDAGTIMGNAASLAQCGGLFQQMIEKSHELRVTIVGSEIFSARINSQDEGSTSVDWRADIFADIYEPHSLSPNLAERLLSLHRLLGLSYGAYDLIVTHDGEAVFLEVNPAGQWLWIEERLGYPISASIARLLADGAQDFAS